MYNKLTPDVRNYLDSQAHAPTEWKPSSNDKGFVQPALFILFEHAAGFSLFSVAEFEEIGVFLPQVEESVADVSKFKSIVKLVGFTPFKTAVAALENMNAISEGIPSEDLRVFLDNTLPKKKKCMLGVADPKLGAGINEVMGIQCIQTGVVPEILRGIRMHFHNLVKGFTDVSAGVAQLGLGHAYSRTKVKFNVNRVDNMIIQSIALLDQLDKDVNTFAMRIRAPSGEKQSSTNEFS